MKAVKKIFLVLGIVLGVAIVCVLGAMGYAAHLFGDQVRAVKSVHEVAPELYEMTYRGDYGIDDFIRRGGVKSDSDLQPFLQEFLSHGLLPVQAGEPDVPDVGCSTLCAPLDADGGWLFGRNFDWAKKGNTIIIRTYPNRGPYSYALGFGSDNANMNNPFIYTDNHYYNDLDKLNVCKQNGHVKVTEVEIFAIQILD